MLVRPIATILIAVLGSALYSGCRKPPASQPSAPQPATLSTGDLRNNVGFYSVVFYYAPDPAVETRQQAEALSKQFLPEIQFSADTSAQPAAPFIGFEEESAPLKEFPVPDADYFKFAGRGLTPAQVSAIQRTSRATRLAFLIPKEHVWTLGRKFTELISEYARQTGAYIWDSATRECFTREAWNARRVETWPEEGFADIESQITIHAYQPSESSSYKRAITLGMEKFALPDLVLERMTGSDLQTGGTLLNFVCQSIAERPQRNGNGEAFRVSELGNPALRDRYSQGQRSGAKLEALLALIPAKPQEGDPGNRLVELDFRHASGNSEDEKRKTLLSSIWGSSESIKDTEHTPEVLAASARAKARLPELQSRFVVGLAPGTRLLVKSPFERTAGQGREWMWVEVMRWPQGGPIDGILQNDPFYIADLRAGSRVRVDPDEVFDYLLYRKDGKPEGNETGDLIDKQQGRVRQK